MSQTLAAPLHRNAQFGHLLVERPSAARITAYAGVIALHVGALMLLLMPMAPPDALPAGEQVIQPIFLRPERVVPPPPPPPIDRVPPRATTTPRATAPIEQPAIVVEESTELAPPPTPPDTAIFVESVTPPGPLAGASLEYVSASPPPYPKDAPRRGIEGTVMLEVLVDVDGRPLDVRVQTSSGNRSLDEAARKHVLKRWMFKPAMQSGRAVQAVGLVPVRFTMR
ncbi:MAG: energy transducer TonB [Lysobacter sp.]|nr:energy transducer TonB [Lysobacter sp.]